MTVPLHDRTTFHTGVEDTTTATLAAPIGRYDRGATVQSVLEDMAARLAAIEGAGCSLVVKSIVMSAWIGGPRALTLNAVIRPNKNLTMDAQIRGTVLSSLPLAAYLVDHVGGNTTLAAPVSSGASTITVTSANGFPATNGYVISINGVSYIVTGGAGSTTWTISPNAASNLPSGTSVTEVC